MVFGEKTSNFIGKTGVFAPKYGEKTLADRNAGLSQRTRINVRGRKTRRRA